MSGGAYAFMPVVEANGIVRFFACGRDDLGRSRIGILTYQWGDTPKLLDVTAEPVLDLGDAGCFDMDGVAYPTWFGPAAVCGCTTSDGTSSAAGRRG